MMVRATISQQQCVRGSLALPTFLLMSLQWLQRNICMMLR